MTTALISKASGKDASPPARRRFGLDTPLPADRRTVERAVLRHLAECRPDVVPLSLNGGVPAGPAGQLLRAPVEAGLPDLLLLAPKGRVAFVKIKTQAEELSRANRAFDDLCRERAIPFVVVRSLPEALRAFDKLGF
jgi:hypothetical protein